MGFPWPALALIFGLLASVGSAQTLYWDLNGATAGAGTTPTGTWNTTTAIWSTNSAGTIATVVYASGANAVFSAGTDATGTYTVTVSGTQNVGSISVEEGTPRSPAVRSISATPAPTSPLHPGARRRSTAW